jgi:flagellar protein FlgJ
MDVSPLQRKVCAADLPLEKLATNPNVSQSEKIGEVSRQFEAVLLRQILTEAQKTNLGPKEDQAAVSGVYNDMITTRLADSISRSGGFGLAKNLAHQLDRQLLHQKSTESAADSVSKEGSKI